MVKSRAAGTVPPAGREDTAAQSGGGVDGLTLRRTIGAFATGVTIVTTSVGSRPVGMTVNSLTSVSLEPPLLLVCLMRGSRTAQAIRRRRRFVVNVLQKHQESLANRFARGGEDHFGDLPVVRNESGLPIIPKALAQLECAVRSVHVAGDHFIVVGEVTSCARDERSPLLFFSGQFFELGVQGGKADWYW